MRNIDIDLMINLLKDCSKVLGIFDKFLNALSSEMKSLHRLKIDIDNCLENMESQNHGDKAELYQKCYIKTIEFLEEQKDWTGMDGEEVCYGVLSAVLHMVDKLSPNKETLMKLVISSLDNFISDKDIEKMFESMNDNKLKN